MTPYRIEELHTLTPQATREILRTWETSVRATHLFLSEENILSLRPLVELGLSHVALYAHKDEAGQVDAFMGVADEKIEMLFLSPQVRGQGLGRAFIDFAVKELRVRYVDVNEQNVQAVGFYEKTGFETFARSEQDPQGNPFPILHMRLKN